MTAGRNQEAEFECREEARNPIKEMHFTNFGTGTFFILSSEAVAMNGIQSDLPKKNGSIEAKFRSQGRIRVGDESRANTEMGYWVE